MAAPVDQTDKKDPSAASDYQNDIPATPSWRNPCGFVGPLLDEVLNPEASMNELAHQSKGEMFGNIHLQATLARNHANDEVKGRFIQECFDDPNADQEFAHLFHEYLPVIPAITSEHINKLQVGESLQKSYQYMQYFAVSLEQVLLDQLIHEGKFYEDFQLIEGKLRQVLCEIQLAMHELAVEPDEEITRDVMAQKYRDYDDKFDRDLRDFIVLKEYIKALSYIGTVFGHFKNLEAENQPSVIVSGDK